MPIVHKVFEAFHFNTFEQQWMINEKCHLRVELAGVDGEEKAVVPGHMFAVPVVVDQPRSFQLWVSEINMVEQNGFTFEYSQKVQYLIGFGVEEVTQEFQVHSIVVAANDKGKKSLCLIGHLHSIPESLRTSFNKIAHQFQKGSEWDGFK